MGWRGSRSGRLRRPLLKVRLLLKDRSRPYLVKLTRSFFLAQASRICSCTSPANSLHAAISSSTSACARPARASCWTNRTRWRRQSQRARRTRRTSLVGAAVSERALPLYPSSSASLFTLLPVKNDAAPTTISSNDSSATPFVRPLSAAVSHSPPPLD